MFQTNYIFKAQYYGRRLESIYRVARRWKITNEEAAELMVNVEMQQSDNKFNQYKLLIEGPVYRGKINLDEYKLLTDGPTIYSDYDINLLDKKNINKSRRLNNIEFDYEMEEIDLLDENTVFLNNNNEMEEKDLLDEDTVFLNSLSSNNSSNQFIQTYDTNQQTNQETNQASKKSTIPKRRHTTICCCF
jgi:hypothetical protein